MANKNRADNKTGYQAVTDRTPPYDAEPLIQKADQQTTIGDDLMDSTIMRIPTIGAINNPSAAFNVDFDFDGGRDRYDIDTTGSADAAFTITLAGLNDNETGILNITKKSNDTFSFGNGLITPFNNTDNQAGQTSIVLFVKVVGNSYIVQIGYNYIVGNSVISDNSINASKLEDSSISTSKYEDDSITNAKLAENSVDTEQLENSSVEKDKIAGDSVGRNEIILSQVPEIIRGNGTPDNDDGELGSIYVRTDSPYTVYLKGFFTWQLV